MNKILLIIFLTISILTLPSIVNAQPTSNGVISVLVNGKQLVFDVPPVIQNGRTLVPVRAIFEAIGAEVTYDYKSNTVISKKGELTVVLPVGKPEALVNGKATQLDVRAVIIEEEHWFRSVL